MPELGAILLLAVPVLSVWGGIFWLMSRSIDPAGPVEHLAEFVGSPNPPEGSGDENLDFRSIEEYIDRAA